MDLKEPLINEQAICAQVRASGNEVTPEVETFAQSTVKRLLLLLTLRRVPAEVAREATKRLADLAESARNVPAGVENPSVARIRAIGRAAAAVRDAVFALLVGSKNPKMA